MKSQADLKVRPTYVAMYRHDRRAAGRQADL